jgi:hypothetical protein
MGILNPTGYKKKKLNQNYNNSQIMQEDYSWCPSTVRNILKNDIYIIGSCIFSTVIHSSSGTCSTL